VCAGVWHVWSPRLLRLRRLQPTGLASVTTAAAALSAWACTAAVIAAALPVATVEAATMLLAVARAAAASRAACGMDAVAISCVAHSHSESCHDLATSAVAGAQLRCVLVCDMCSRRDWTFGDGSPLACVCDDCGHSAFSWAVYSCGDRSCVARRYSGDSHDAASSGACSNSDVVWPLQLLAA
jgi:hypothetical protein